MIERIKAAWRCLTRGDGLYAPEIERDDGWTDYIHPSAPSYMLECCDCGLVHEMKFHIAPAMGIVPKGSFNPGETEDDVIWFTARRA